MLHYVMDFMWICIMFVWNDRAVMWILQNGLVDNYISPSLPCPWLSALQNLIPKYIFFLFVQQMFSLLMQNVTKKERKLR